MIVSDKFKYVFLETPRTGSTAIAQELCELYAGKRMVRKHANYYDFLKHAAAIQKQYFVFAGVRNPLDSVISKYSKLKNNHKGRYTDPAFLRKNGGWITSGDLKRFHFAQQHNFTEYIKKFYKTPFLNTLSVHHAICDYIIRFETLNDDFEKVLLMLHIEPKRPLPLVNPTAKTRVAPHDNFHSAVQKKSVNVFGPYMKIFGYDLPAEWEIRQPSRLSNALYFAKVMAAKAYCFTQARTGVVKQKYVSSQ